MAEGSYVKLTKAQASLQDVEPGELNQPIDVHQLTARRCEACKQILPPHYEPPADEDWTTGICACSNDPQSCWIGLFCPCVQFGRNIEGLDEGISYRSACVAHVICVEGGLTLAAATAMLHGIDPNTQCLITEGLLFAWWMCGIYSGLARQALQRKYHLKDSPCDPCLTHCTMHSCALCQEHREMKSRLEDQNVEMTMIDAPSIQEMNNITKEENLDNDTLTSNNLQIQAS